MIHAREAAGPEESPAPSGPLPGILAAFAGPVLIVSSVLFQLRAFAFGGLITFQHQDILAFWLPTYCLMGKTVAAGHVPVWNPYVMTGAPLAADPQSGWMSVLPMLLFPTTSCGAAIRWLVVLVPIVAGLGLYGFLRSEGVSRPASTVGGLSLALTLAASRLGVSIPFASAVAWSAVTLWAASRMMRAVDRPSRFAWVAATSLAWGQVVAAHPSHGQLIGSGALAFFLVAKGVVLVRERGVRHRSLLVLAAVLGVSLLAVNLAILLPRAAYFSRTELSVGYESLQDPSIEVLEETAASGASWPLKLSVAPGAYLGSMVLLIVGGGLWSRRWRYLAIAFAAFATMYYLLSVDVVYRASAPIVKGLPMADQLYLHQPWRFGLALIIALPILGAIGFESWLQQRHDGGAVRLWMVLPGFVLWVLGTAVLMSPGRLGLFAAGIVVSAALLVGASRTTALIRLLPIVLAVELLVNGAIGLAAPQPRKDVDNDPFATRFLYGPLFRPTIPVDRYLGETGFVEPIRASGRRYLTIRRYHFAVAPPFWAGLGDSRSILFEIEEGNGYNPAQPVRYWRFIRSVNQASGEWPGRYNTSVVRALTLSVVDLLDVGWVISPRKAPKEPWVVPVADERGWVLSRVEQPLGRASIPTRWTVLGRAEGLSRVAHATFDPESSLVLEVDPGVPPGPVEDASAEFGWTGPASARVAVSTPEDAVVLIRNGWDPNWHATVDGRERPVLVGDYFLQAVAVPAGAHTIELLYDDPWVGRGAAGSALALLALVGLASVHTARLRRSSALEP